MTTYSIALAFCILQKTGTSADLYPPIENGISTKCSGTKADTCIVHCNEASASIPSVSCSNVGTCIINCTAFQCLSSTKIYATGVTDLQFTSTGPHCVDYAHLYLPIDGNATIIADTQSTSSQVMDHFSIHASQDKSSGTSTDHIYFECTDASNDINIVRDCYGVYMDVAAARYLEIVINGAELNGPGTNYGQIHCPVNSSLSPSCVLYAYEGASTTNLKIFAHQGIPQDLAFLVDDSGDYTGTSITCNKGTSTITTGNMFTGDCVTLQPTLEIVFCEDCADVEQKEQTQIVRIDIDYLFGQDITFVLDDMECHLYQIFVEWFEKYSFGDTFTACDINTHNVTGGTEGLCDTTPCIEHMMEESASRSYCVMTIIVTDQDTYQIIEYLVVEGMESDFESYFTDRFGVAMDVEVVGTMQEDKKGKSKDGLAEKGVFIIVGLAIICCLIGVVVTICCVRHNRKRQRKKIRLESHESTEGDKCTTQTMTTTFITDTPTRPKTKAKGKNYNIRGRPLAEQDSNDGPVEMEEITSPDFGRYAMKDSEETTARNDGQDMVPHGTIQMANNAIYGAEKEEPETYAGGNVNDIISPDSLLMGQGTYLARNDDDDDEPDSLLMGKGTFLNNNQPFGAVMSPPGPTLHQVNESGNNAQRMQFQPPNAMGWNSQGNPQHVPMRETEKDVLNDSSLSSASDEDQRH